MVSRDTDRRGDAVADDGDFQSPTMRGMMFGMAPSILVNGVLTVVAYQVLLSHHVPSVTALILTALIPAAWTVGSLAHSRRVDTLGAVSLILLVLSLVASLVSGNAQFILIKESFLTGLFGLVFLGSFLLPRPLMFYFGRQFATGGEPHRIAYWDSLWQYPSFRHV